MGSVKSKRYLCAMPPPPKSSDLFLSLAQHFGLKKSIQIFNFIISDNQIPKVLLDLSFVEVRRTLIRSETMTATEKNHERLTRLFPDDKGSVEKHLGGQQDPGEDEELLGRVGSGAEGLVDHAHQVFLRGSDDVIEPHDREVQRLSCVINVTFIHRTAFK